LVAVDIVAPVVVVAAVVALSNEVVHDLF